ncbi:MAG: hypothetical protein EKK49_13140 [Rhodocyclaceae bacterium]|nr:MAG: hypothetical protein EKK49_13140 [Rhodocyclaceae bacterium]
MARPPKQLPTARPIDINRHIGDLAEQLAGDPKISRFTISADKERGIVTSNVQHVDGRIQDDKWITKGLSQTTRFDPRSLTTTDRNFTVMSLLNSGYTQAETARLVGLSQSRIAQIKKESEAAS